ncbi:MAG TPA: hypothetical protein GXX60_00295 [Anaerolineaceae bacterium]|nr:hypothetical protein [Anaerolineaceae bacterium]
MDECRHLLRLARNNSEDNVVNALMKSAIVLAIAYWERHIEDLLLKGCAYISDSLRNPLDLPLKTRQVIAESSVTNKRESNPEAFSSSVWAFSGDGWSRKYKEYVQKRADALNTASIKNVREAFADIFGIKDVFPNKEIKDFPGINISEEFNHFMNVRHKIAHGDRTALEGVTIDDIEKWLIIEYELVAMTMGIAWDALEEITGKSAIAYHLKERYVYQILLYFKENGQKTVTNDVFKKIGSTANSNYKKLSYEPWSLLDVKGPKNIYPTDRLFQFLNNELELPSQVLVLKNFKARAKRGTPLIKFNDLQDEYEHKIFDQVSINV